MTNEEFRLAGHQVVDWIADYRERLGSQPVMSTVEPGSIKARVPEDPPQAGEPFSSILQDLDDVLGDGITHWNHPRWFGYFPANASLASVLGDLVRSGIGAIGLNWQAAPALTEVEELVTDWLRRMVGLSDHWHGVIQDTASTATLVALLCARERTTSHGQAAGGLQAEDAPLTVYGSTESHSSVEKAALLAGFGRDNVRLIETDERHAIRADALSRTIEADLAAGRRPSAVIATVGTTATTAIDPLESIAGIAREHRLWLHVDAAMAGSAMILPECRWMWQGIEGADSLVINAHKWLGAVFDTSLYYVRDPGHLIRTMSTNPSYLATAADTETTSYRDWGIPLGRRFRSLKLWWLIREQGVHGLQTRIRRDLNNARWLAAEIEAAPNWQCVAPVPLQTVCVRHTPPQLAAKSDALDAHTLGWVGRINRGGDAYLTPARLDDRWMVRVSVGAEPTTRADVERLWAVMRREAER